MELLYEFVILYIKIMGRFYFVGSDGGDCYFWCSGKFGGV